MIGSKQYIVQVIARLNAVTVPQIQRLCRGRFCRTVIYTSVRWLIENGYVVRVSHPLKAVAAFQATEKARSFVYGDKGRRIRDSRERDIVHSLACADAAIGLSFYPNIKALAFDDELTPVEVERFSLNRRPDIIAQVVHGNTVREFSIEVENSLQSKDYVEGLLDNYQRAFERGLQCTALLIVARQESVCRRYLESVAKRPESFDLRAVVTRDSLLQSLNSEICGVPTAVSSFRWDLVRSEFTNRIEYASVNSNTYEFPETHKQTPIGSHTEIQN